MHEKESFKWLKLIWSIVFMGIVSVFYFVRVRNSQPDLGSGFQVFALSLAVGTISIIVSPVFIVLRLFRIIRDREFAMYILLIVINCFLSILGVIYLFAARFNWPLFVRIVFVALFAGLMIVDAFFKEFPDLRTEKK